MKRVRGVVDRLVNKEAASPKQDPPAIAGEETINGTSSSNGVATLDEKMDAACIAFKDIKLPDRLLADGAHALFSTVLKLDESGRETGAQLLIRLRSDNLISQDKLWDGLKQVQTTTMPMQLILSLHLTIGYSYS